MRQIHHPKINEITLSTVMHALSDPARLSVVRALAENGEQCCAECGGDMPKPTLSHHFKVLRESGLIQVRIDGTQRCMTLRREELNQRFPGLLDAVLNAPAD